MMRRVHSFRVPKLECEKLLSVFVGVLLLVACYQWFEMFAWQRETLVHTGATPAGTEKATKPSSWRPRLWQQGGGGGTMDNIAEGSVSSLKEQIAVLQQTLTEKEHESQQVDGELKLLYQELKDVKEGCEVKLKRFSEENTILLHKLAHINLRGRP